MAYTKKLKKKEKVEKPNYGFLDSLEKVKVNTPVRFRFKVGGTWTKGIILGDNKDGSLTLLDASGKMRAIMPKYIEVQVDGKKKWESIS